MRAEDDEVSTHIIRRETAVGFGGLAQPAGRVAVRRAQETTEREHCPCPTWRGGRGGSRRSDHRLPNASQRREAGGYEAVSICSRP